MDQLAGWVNADLGVEPKVVSFETQFSNGVLFGRILHQLGALDEAQLEEMRDNHASAAKRRNFATLVPAIRSMGVRVERNLVDDIATEQRGAAVKLLQRIREATSKYIPPSQRRDARRRSELASRARSRASSSRRPASQSSRPLSVETAVRHGQGRNTVWQAAHMARFEELQATLEEQADRAEAAELRRLAAAARQRHDSMRAREEQQRTWRRDFERELARESAKLRAWHLHRDREALAVELGVWAKQKAQTGLRQEADANDAQESIAAMERNLLQLGLSNDVDDDDPVELDDVERATLFSELHKSQRETSTERASRIRQRLRESLHRDESEAFLAALRVRARREAIARRDQATRQRIQAARHRATQQVLDEEAAIKARVDAYLREARNERMAAAQQWNMRAQMQHRDSKRQEAIAKREEDRTASVVDSLRKKEKGSSGRPYDDPVRVVRRAELAAESRRKHAEATDIVANVVDEFVSLVLDVLPHMEETEEVRDGIRDRGVPPNLWRQWKRAFVRGSYGVALRQARKEAEETKERQIKIAGGWGLPLPVASWARVLRNEGDAAEDSDLVMDGADSSFATTFTGSDAMVWSLTSAVLPVSSRTVLKPLALANGGAMESLQRSKRVSCPVDPDVVYMGSALGLQWYPAKLPAKLRFAWRLLHALSVWSDAVPETHPPMSQLLDMRPEQAALLQSVPLTLAPVPPAATSIPGNRAVSILGPPKCGSSTLALRLAARTNSRVIDQTSIVHDAISFFIWSERRQPDGRHRRDRDQDEREALGQSSCSFAWCRALSGEARSTLWVVGRSFLLAAGGECAVQWAMRNVVISSDETENANDGATEPLGDGRLAGEDGDLAKEGESEVSMSAEPVPIDEAWTMSWECARETRAAWLGDWDIGASDKGSSSKAAAGKKGGAGGKKGAAAGKKGEAASPRKPDDQQAQTTVPFADRMRESRAWRTGLALSVLASMRLSPSSSSSAVVLDDMPLSPAELVAVEFPAALAAGEVVHSPLLTHVPGFIEQVAQEDEPLATIPGDAEDEGVTSRSVARGRVSSWPSLFQWLCRAWDLVEEGSWEVPDPTVDPLREDVMSPAGGKGGKQPQRAESSTGDGGWVSAPLHPTDRVPMSDSVVRLWAVWEDEEPSENAANEEEVPYWGPALQLPKEFRPPQTDGDDGTETELEVAPLVAYPYAARNRRWQASSAFRDRCVRPSDRAVILDHKNATEGSSIPAMAHEEQSLREGFPGLGAMWTGPGLQEYTQVASVLTPNGARDGTTPQESADVDADVATATDQLWAAILEGTGSLRQLSRAPMLLAMWWKRERSAQSSMEAVLRKWRETAVQSERACFQRGKRFLRALSRQEPCTRELAGEHEEAGEDTTHRSHASGRNDAGAGMAHHYPDSGHATRRMGGSGLSSKQLAASAVRRGRGGVLHRAYVPPDIRPLRRPRRTNRKDNVASSKQNPGGWPGESRLHRCMKAWRGHCTGQRHGGALVHEQQLGGRSEDEALAGWRNECIECVDLAWAAVERRWGVARAVLQSWDGNRLAFLEADSVVHLAMAVMDAALQRAADRILIGAQLCRSNLCGQSFMARDVQETERNLMASSLKDAADRETRDWMGKSREGVIPQLRAELCEKCESVGHAWDSLVQELEQSDSVPLWLLQFAGDEMERTAAAAIQSCWSELHALFELDVAVHGRCREVVAQWVRLADRQLRDIRVRVTTDPVPSAELLHRSRRLCPDVSDCDDFGAVACHENEHGFSAVLPSSCGKKAGAPSAGIYSNWLRSISSAITQECLDVPIVPSLRSLWSRHILGQGRTADSPGAADRSDNSFRSSQSVGTGGSASLLETTGVSVPEEPACRGMASGREQLALVPDQVEPPSNKHTRPLSPGLKRQLRDTIGETALARRRGGADADGGSNDAVPRKSPGAKDSVFSPLFAPAPPFETAKWSPAGWEALCSAIRAVWMEGRDSQRLESSAEQTEAKEDTEETRAEREAFDVGMSTAVGLVRRALRCVADTDTALVPRRWLDCLKQSEASPSQSPLRKCLEHCGRGSSSRSRAAPSLPHWDGRARRIVQRFVLSLATSSFVPTVPTLWQWIGAWVSLRLATQPAGSLDSEPDDETPSAGVLKQDPGLLSSTEWKHVRLPWEIPPAMATQWVARSVHRSSTSSPSQANQWNSWCGMHSSEEAEVCRQEALAMLASQCNVSAASVEVSLQALRSSLPWLYGTWWRGSDEEDETKGSEEGGRDEDAASAPPENRVDVATLFRDWMQVPLQGGVPGVPTAFAALSRPVVWNGDISTAVTQWHAWRARTVESLWSHSVMPRDGAACGRIDDAVQFALWPTMECPSDEPARKDEAKEEREGEELPWLGDAGIDAQLMESE